MLTALCVLPAGLAAQADDDHGHDAHGHPNHIAVGVGGMTPLSETGNTSFALGADYYRSLGPRWGLGVAADFTFGDHKRGSLMVAGAGIQVTPGLRLSAGPGFEVVDKEKSDGSTSSKAFFVWFVAALYEFHVGGWSLGPQVAVDFVGETKTNLTYQIAVGRGF